MKLIILSLFPKMFIGPLNESVLLHAQKKGLLDIEIINIRDFTADKHKTVDDTPYGGGPGMVMKVDVIDSALRNLKIKMQKSRQRPDSPAKRGERGSPRVAKFKMTNQNSKIILLTPQGKVYTQKTAQRLSKYDNIILIAGHFEGYDERIRSLVDEEISIGDYILTGGEIPAMVLVDSIVRLIPVVVGKKESLHEESFSQLDIGHSGIRHSLEIRNSKIRNLLEYPHYTRPSSYTPKSISNAKPMKVPKILLSGNHQKIAQWRAKKAMERTRKRRTDLIE